MIRVASSIGLARMKQGRFVSDIRVWHMRSGPGVVPVQRGMEFHPLSISAAGLRTLGQHAGKPRFIGHRQCGVEQPVEKFLELVLWGSHLAHVAASGVSERSIQSSSVRRTRRSISDTALGCFPIVAAMALTEAPGS